MLTGSSARRLRKKGINLLAGRALTYNMHPLVIQEMGDAFNLTHALRYGLLPKAAAQINPKKYLTSYTKTYVQEEVLQEGLTRDIGAFSRFLEAAAFSQGAVLNFTEMGRELSINRLTVANYFDILEDLLLSVRLNPFTYRAKREVISHQKFYFFDVGVFRALRKINVGDLIPEIEGIALETLFLQSAQAINDYLDLDYTIYFWRTISQLEVDFILSGPNGLHAFEIKRSDKLSKKALRGLNEFGEDYPEAKLYILYMGKDRRYFGRITAIPFEDALRKLPEILKPTF